jgi:hypothetical protein
VVVRPRGYPVSNIPRALQQRARWILKHLNTVPKASLAASTSSIRVEEGQRLLFLGEEVILRLLRIPNAFSSLIQGAVQDGEIRLFLPAQHVAWHDQEQRRLLVEALYRTEAQHYFRQRSQYWATRMGVTFQRITIKEQKTRWGSCSNRGNLNFNWRLMFAPRPVIDYVVVHELTHRLHMNHSPAFWDTVRHYLPDFGIHRRWLKDHGHLLW